MDFSDKDILLANIEQDKIKVYNDVDLNSLFNLNYNFDLLKGIIGALLKNQQFLQKQIDYVNSVNKERAKTIDFLKNEILEIQTKYTTREDFLKARDLFNKVNDMYQMFDEQKQKGKHIYILYI
jgi:hypothetical protein